MIILKIFQKIFQESESEYISNEYYFFRNLQLFQKSSTFPEIFYIFRNLFFFQVCSFKCVVRFKYDRRIPGAPPRAAPNDGHSPSHSPSPAQGFGSDLPAPSLQQASTGSMYQGSGLRSLELEINIHPPQPSPSIARSARRPAEFGRDKHW